MSDGEGCHCYASSPSECCCDDVDWRSSREVELEAENARLRAELAAAKMYQPCQRKDTPHVPVKAIGPCDFAKWGIIESDEALQALFSLSFVGHAETNQ